MIELVRNGRIKGRIERTASRWSRCHLFALGHMDGNYVICAVIVIVVTYIVVAVVIVSFLVGQRS
jgi:hypothetical protein